MGNNFGSDILIQAPDPKQAALFYVDQLGFTITDESPDLISLQGANINFYIERGLAIGTILEVMVDDVDAAKARLVAGGATVIKDEPDVPRCYVRDPNGLIYNLRS